MHRHTRYQNQIFVNLHMKNFTYLCKNKWHSNKYWNRNKRNKKIIQLWCVYTLLKLFAGILTACKWPKSASQRAGLHMSTVGFCAAVWFVYNIVNRRGNDDIQRRRWAAYFISVEITMRIILYINYSETLRGLQCSAETKARGFSWTAL